MTGVMGMFSKTVTSTLGMVRRILIASVRLSCALLNDLKEYSMDYIFISRGSTPLAI